MMSILSYHVFSLAEDRGIVLTRLELYEHIYGAEIVIGEQSVQKTRFSKQCTCQTSGFFSIFNDEMHLLFGTWDVFFFWKSVEGDSLTKNRMTSTMKTIWSKLISNIRIDRCLWKVNDKHIVDTLWICSVLLATNHVLQYHCIFPNIGSV